MRRYIIERKIPSIGAADAAALQAAAERSNAVSAGSGRATGSALQVQQTRAESSARQRAARKSRAVQPNAARKQRLK
jgi:hypothetical protein